MAERPERILSLVRRRREDLAVATLLLVALGLRLFQVDWDQGHLYHPDERYILMTTAGLSLSWPPNLSQLLSPQSTLDPHGFAYGSFPFYLLRLIAAILIGVSHLGGPFRALAQLNDLANLRLIGRPISALFDTGTVFIIYQLGKRLYGRRIALLGAAFVTFSVLDIQLSHFYATDTMMTCLALAAVLASVTYLQEGTTRSAVWAGIFTGLALGTKVSAAPVLAPVGVAYLLRLFAVDRGAGGLGWHTPSAEALTGAMQILLWSIAAGILTFLVVEPYALIDAKRFVTDVAAQGAMVRGIADLPYTRQFIGRPPYLYFLQILVLFGVGIPLGLAMLGGWLYVIARAIRLPRRGDLLLLSYVVPYFAITGDFYAKFMRYLLPITPLLALFAAVGLLALLDRCRSWRLGAMPRVEPASNPAPALADGGLEDALPEIVDEGLLDDDSELRFFDGTDQPGTEGTTPPSAVPPGASAQAVAPSPVASAHDRDALRFAELKGLPLEWFSDPGDRATGVAGQRQLAAEVVRFAELKGLSVEWLAESFAEPERSATESADDASGDVCSESLEWSEPRVEPAALPSWLVRRSSLAGFLVGPWPSRFALTLIGVVLAFSVFYSLAFDHMYASTSTPVEASLWLYQHAPPGSTLATEHWEEGMPVPIVTATGVISADSLHYRNVTMPMYDDDNEQKLTTIINNLEAADYIVFFSNRLYGTIPRLPGRYPMSRRYYELLFGEKLGFKLVAAFDRYPNLLGVAFVDDTLNDPGLPTPPLLQQQRVAPITINLGHADESFSVYDHQKVLIFQKVQRLSPDQLRALIGPPPAPTTLVSNGPAPRSTALVYTPAQEAVVQAGGTFRDLFDRHDVLNHDPLLAWAVLIVLVSLAGLPLGFLVFRFLPDRGYLVSRTLGVLVLAWLSWLIVALGVVEVTRASTLASFGLYLLIGTLAWFLQRGGIVSFVRAHWRLVLVEEGLFWLAFCYDVVIRSLDPDLWHPTLGGEKPMDLAYFTAAARSPIYPPYDPWFAGGFLNYYYFGQIIVGTLTRISGVLPTTSYNIVVPLLFAMTVGGAFTAAFGLLQRGEERPGRSAVLGGVLASLMVCVLGNLGGFLQLVQEIEQAAPVQARSSVPAVGEFLSFFSGLVAIASGQHPFVLRQDWYWSSTRMLALLGQPGTGSINEFPYFTFLFADLHAHLIGLPFTLLAIALSVNVVKSGGLLAHLPEVRLGGSALGPAFAAAAPTSDRDSSDQAAGEADRPGGVGVTVGIVAAVAAAALTLGALYPINTWDYPTYLGLFALSSTIPWYLAKRRTTRGLATVVFRLALVVVLGRLLYEPFYAFFQSFYSGVHAIDEKSTISWFVAINGLFLGAVLCYLAVRGWLAYRRSGIVRLTRLSLTRWDMLPRMLELRRVLVKRTDAREIVALYGLVWLTIGVVGAFVFGMALTGVLVVLLVATLAIALRRDQSPEECLVLGLFATGLALAIGTEQVAIDGDIGRMNTVFKFYEQIWVLWGIAGAVAIVWTGEKLWAIAGQSLRTAWLTLMIALFAMAAVYPVLGTISRVSNRFDASLPPTLDGTAYMNTAVYVDDGHPLRLITDKEAITWLQDHIEGTPIILEGNRPIYRWGSRYSIYTGLPTVIGWDWHQKQQRWGYRYLVDERLNDVARMYDDPSPALTLSLLRTYHVRYVIDGELEQAFYPAARAKFDSMVGTALTVVYDHDGVKIYRVRSHA